MPRPDPGVPTGTPTAHSATTTERSSPLDGFDCCANDYGAGPASAMLTSCPRAHPEPRAEPSTSG